MKLLHLIRTSWGRLTSGLLAMLALCWLNGAKFTGVIDWEPTLTFVTLALAWLYSCLPDQAEGRIAGEAAPIPPEIERKVSAHDRELFEKFKEIFDDNLFGFLREHDMGAAFDLTLIEGLREVSAVWKGALYRFDDPDLADPFEELLSEIRKFSHAIAVRTHIIGSSNYARIQWDHENEDAARNVARELNELADAVNRKADEFIIMARKKIA